jgi:hypothetical protein
MENIIVPRRLNEAQLVLLRLFDRPIMEDEVTELRDFLVAYYNKKLQKELNKVITEKKMTVHDIEQFGNFENRTEKLRQIRNRS